MTEEEFEHFLAWLHADREAAALLYQSLRLQLINYFSQSSCLTADAEMLADRTLDRVARYLFAHEVQRQADVWPYFRRFARYVLLEHLRAIRPIAGEELDENSTLPDNAEETEEREVQSRCLHICLAQLPDGKRHTFIRYYGIDKRQKIQARVALAEELGCSLNALRLQMLRLREDLSRCIEQCMENRRQR